MIYLREHVHFCIVFFSSFITKDDAWNNVEMMYDGKVLTARVRALKSKGERVEEMDSKPLTGIIYPLDFKVFLALLILYMMYLNYLVIKWYSFQIYFRSCCCNTHS